MSPNQLLTLFKTTRDKTEHLCSFLKTEDYVVQPILDVSPPKWHLGHTSWFFEEFILKKHKKDYHLFNKDFAYFFNSYYESLGEKVIRDDRGNLSRPTVEEIYNYRKYITNEMMEFIKLEIPEELEETILIGIHHEKQHQELLLTDIKYILGINPLFPVYNNEFNEKPIQEAEMEWLNVSEGIYTIGHQNPDEFCFDNELSPHKVYLHEYSICSKLVTNYEYLDFMEDGGYDNVLHWHAEGWDWVKQNDINSPFYWHKRNGEWFHYTLNGLQKVDWNAPVTHISYYEAFAYSQWKELRLPTEFEWEAAQHKLQTGSRWEWTESAYLPYPGYKKADGAIGEYNGKFMVNQMVLRGGSVATAEEHFRPSYRNFFHPHLRWQYTGIRLAK